MTGAPPKQLLSAIGLAAALVLLIGAGILVLLPHSREGGLAAVGGPFSLTSQDGKTVTEDALKGQPSLVFFGYTHCPDVCPATLSEISALFKALGPENKAKAFFVTVDPERDTPAVLKDYLTSFPGDITGLTGSPEAIRKMEVGYKAFAKAVPDKDGTYTMDHTAITYLMDKHGSFLGAFNLDRPAGQAATELKQYF